MKAIHALYSLLSLNDQNVYQTSKPKLKEALPRKSKDQIAIEHGLKSFQINGVEVIALNRKNAIKKYNKQHKNNGNKQI